MTGRYRKKDLPSLKARSWKKELQDILDTDPEIGEVRLLASEYSGFPITYLAEHNAGDLVLLIRGQLTADDIADLHEGPMVGGFRPMSKTLQELLQQDG